jgi:hypothetical protein
MADRPAPNSERERDDLQRRIADAEAEAATIRTLTAWCQRVAATLGTLSYDERRMALATLGHHWRSGQPRRGRAVPAGIGVSVWFPLTETQGGG